MIIDFHRELDSIRVHQSGKVVSLHKPLLLLLTISEILHGHQNQFLYDDLEDSLTILLHKYGLKNTQKVSPQYPFLYLTSNSAIWKCTVAKETLKHPNTASRKDLLGAIGSFTPEFFRYLLSSSNGVKVIQHLLNSYWPRAYHAEILNDLGLFELLDVQLAAKKDRSRKFVEEVLDAYERKCAICTQSIRLGDALVGIDACHLKPIQHFGADTINNGIALCKIHHWAIDRGAISISNEMGLMISKKLNGNKLFEYFTSFENKPVFAPRDQILALHEANIVYHNKYIFVK
jgi:putative restriction endonuclease